MELYRKIFAKKVSTDDVWKEVQKFYAEEHGWRTQPDARIAFDESNPCLAQELCSRCSTLDLRKIEQPYGQEKPEILVELGDLSEATPDSPCPLCRLFSLIRPSSPWNSYDDTSSLGSRSSFDVSVNSSENSLVANYVKNFVLCRYPSDILHEFRRPLNKRDTACVLSIMTKVNYEMQREGPWVLPNPNRSRGYIMPFAHFDGSSSEHYRYLRPVGPEVDFELVSQWVRYCDKYHTGTCRKSPWSRHSTAASHVIDCKERKVVRISMPLKYLALSYVWGPPTDDDNDVSTKTGLPSTLPALIQDAMTVALSLNYRYLWVDRYCLPRNNELEKLRQIGNMNTVFEQAEATLIAASNENRNQGIPGVSSNPRDMHPCAKLGALCVFWTFQDPAKIIASSQWMRRAWTYQEALVSRRRIFFTQQQVYFECKGMHQCEALRVPCFESRPGAWSRYRDMGQVWRRRDVFDTDRDLTNATLFAHLQQFRVRTLTSESDRLNAFLGMLNLYQKAKDPIFHFMGVPILPPTARTYSHGSQGHLVHRETRQRSIDGNFAAGLCWTTPWKRYITCRRQIGFPSWSWTGWSIDFSQAEMERRDFPYKMQPVNETSREYDFPYEMDPVISLNLKSGRRAKLSELTGNLKPERLDLYSPVITIEAWATRLPIKRFEHGQLFPVPGHWHEFRHRDQSRDHAREILLPINHLWAEIETKDGRKAYVIPQFESVQVYHYFEELCRGHRPKGSEVSCTAIMFENPFEKNVDRFWPSKHDFDGSFIMLVSCYEGNSIMERVGHLRAGLKELWLPRLQTLKPEVLTRDQELTQDIDWRRETIRLS